MKQQVHDLIVEKHQNCPGAQRVSQRNALGIVSPAHDVKANEQRQGNLLADQQCQHNHAEHIRKKGQR